MKKIIFTLIVLCLYITPVRAFELALTGSDTIEKTESYLLEISKFGEYTEFYGLTAKLNYDKEKLELLEITANNNFNLAYSAKTNKIVLYNAISIKEAGAIINLKFKNIGLKSDEKTNITITGINASDGAKDIKVNDVTKELTATKEGIVSNNNLSEIKINCQELDLSDGGINYEIVVSNDTEEISINAISNNKKAEVIGNDTYKLNEGSNEIKITVKDGEDEKTYTINVNREDSKSTLNEDDLFIKKKKFKWNNLYFIPVSIIILIPIIILIIKKKGK